ncbi:hypothetical protein [Gracilimonas halophila]|uniref:Uncharacterized protein n=1 Tax=Gracilimonas halophila TaxID=1834464 RepID=A0ABW5JK75_9BACT
MSINGKDKIGSSFSIFEKFVRDIQMKSQDRFIKRAQNKGVPKEVTEKMEKVNKEVEELEEFLKSLY